ncbi:MAG: xanthine dehydrogenase [Betaproteobacteria bacterium]|nr:MAG: xanthine dehydrogenase [Betaproteobacteria bacterium]
MKWSLFEQLQQSIKAGASAAVVVRLSDGAEALFDGQGWQDALWMSETQCSQALRMLVADRSGTLPDSEEFFVRSYARAPRLIVIGAAHISQFLAPMASLAGFEVMVVDPRRAFANPERFGDVKLIHKWPDEALADLKLDATSAVVTLTHDPKLDDPALIAALRSPAFYVGALGSKRTHAKRVARLTEAGLADKIARIHAPVGLDLGGRAPREIAVSILAQVIQVRYRGTAG